MLPAQKRRYEIIQKIQQTLYEARIHFLGVKKEKLISQLCMYEGSERRKALEYIKTIINSGFAYEMDDEVWMSKEEFERRQNIDKAFELSTGYVKKEGKEDGFS